MKRFTKTSAARLKTLFAMDTNTAPTKPSTIDDLFKLHLVDGLKATAEGRAIHYKVVRLRETDVNDERLATRLAERVVNVRGVDKLLVSDADFRIALTMRHVEAFECDGLKIPQAALDLDLFGKLSSHDLGLIERRVFLITLAAEVRYGLISQEDFDTIMAGGSPSQEGSPAPRSMGQAAAVGAVDPSPEPGPALLADFTGQPAAGAPARAGR